MFMGETGFEIIDSENIEKKILFFETIQRVFSEYPVKISFFGMDFEPLSPGDISKETAILLSEGTQSSEIIVKHDKNHYYFSRIILSKQFPAADFPDNYFIKGFPEKFYVIGRLDSPIINLDLYFKMIDLLVNFSIRNFQEQGIGSNLFKKTLEATISEMKAMNDKEHRLRQIFQRYVPAKVVKEILNIDEKDFLKGHITEVTILFTDIRGFTSLAETLTPDNLVEMLDDYFSFMINIILQFEGDIYKFMGDGMIAVFEGTAAQSMKALEAALEIKNTLVRFNYKRKEKGLVELNMGIGINSGKVLIGNIGNEKRSDYTIIGDVVNIASRLEHLTKKYNSFLVITDTTFKLIQEHLIARELDSIRVKGRVTPLVIYEVIAKADETDESMLEMLKEYNQGLILYRIRQWEGAMHHFRNVIKIRDNDGPALIYMDRCFRYTLNPPPEHWDGIIDAESIENIF